MLSLMHNRASLMLFTLILMLLGTFAPSSIRAQEIEPEAQVDAEEEEAFGDDFDDDDFDDDLDDDEEEEEEEDAEQDATPGDSEVTDASLAASDDVAEVNQNAETEVGESTDGAATDDSNVTENENTEAAQESAVPKKEVPKVEIKNRLSGVGLGAAEAVYQTLSKTVAHFEKEASAVREEIRLLAERRYKERKKKIERKYDGSIDPLLVQERQARLDAIAAFERFLQRHPGNPDFTPDAIFRLAELQFEYADEVYQAQLKDYREAYDAYSAGHLPEPPEEPEQRFDRTIELYQWLVKDFPEYRFVDGAYYLLGYALQAQGDTKEGLSAWETLARNHQESRFFDEVAFRVGDYYFQEEVWDKAIEAFLWVTPKKESRFYDKALYNLAWTYYLVNRFDEAVERFVELLDFPKIHKNRLK